MTCKENGSKRKDEINNESLLSIYREFRDYVKHEDSLINYRITWMLSIHGFLYATYGFTLQKVLEISDKIGTVIKMGAKNEYVCYMSNPIMWKTLNHTLAFLWGITFVGAFITIFAYFSIAAAYETHSSLITIFESQNKSLNFKFCGHGQPREVSVYELGPNKLPQITGGGHGLSRRNGYIAAMGIPGALFFSWVISGFFLGQEYTAISHMFLPKFVCPWE